MKEYVQIEITEEMRLAYKSCNEDSDCEGCPSRIGHDDCVFNHDRIG